MTIPYSHTKKISISVLCGFLLVWAYISGKDINWDFLNYHLYSSYLMVDGRWTKDFFAASIQSYLNPISYIPIYFMVMSGIPDVVMMLVLISPALLSILLIWNVCEEIIPSPEKNISIIFLMVALASTTSLWLIVVGSTFNDSLACAITLASLLTLLKSTKKSWMLLLVAGFFTGLSAGIKLTNGSYAPALILACIFLYRKEAFPIIIKNIAILCAGIAMGFLISHGYWSWKLWSEFKNPFFPFFNGFFKSPDFLPENLQDRRFMGDSWLGIFSMPFRMPMIQPWIYNEASAPEIKIAIVLLIIPAIFVKFSIKKYTVKTIECNRFNENLVAVTIFILISYLVWSTSSRIGRYAIFVWMICGVIIPAWILLIFNQSTARVVGLFLLIVQCFLNVNAGISHWSPTSWGGAWFKPEIPKMLTDKPHSVITTALQTFSAIAPFTHKDNRWFSVAGQYNMPSGDNMPLRLRDGLHGNDIVAIIPSLDGNKVIYKGPSEMERNLISSLFLAYGLSPKSFDCAPIRIRQTTITPWSNSKIDNTVMLHACPMKVGDTNDMVNHQAQIAQYDAIFNSIEDQCPRLFSPRRSNSFSVENEFSRFYFNTSIHLYSEGNKIMSRMPQQLVRQVIAVIDRDTGGITSEIKCPLLPKKLYLD